MTVTVVIKTRDPLWLLIIFPPRIDIEKKNQNKTGFLPYSMLQSDVVSQTKYFVTRAKLFNLPCK